MMPGSRPRARPALVAGLALVGLSLGCGYSSGLRVAQHHRSVGVQVFGNDSYERDLEQPLYEEISRALRDYSDAPLVAPDEADAVLRGKITAFRRRSGIRSPENKLLETGVYVEVEATLSHPGAKQPIKGPVKAGAWVGYVIGPSENEREARARVLRHVAEELVLDLLAPVN